MATKDLFKTIVSFPKFENFQLTADSENHHLWNVRYSTYSNKGSSTYTNISHCDCDHLVDCLRILGLHLKAGESLFSTSPRSKTARFPLVFNSLKTQTIAFPACRHICLANHHHQTLFMYIYILKPNHPGFHSRLVGYLDFCTVWPWSRLNAYHTIDLADLSRPIWSWPICSCVSTHIAVPHLMQKYQSVFFLAKGLSCIFWVNTPAPWPYLASLWVKILGERL